MNLSDFYKKDFFKICYSKKGISLNILFTITQQVGALNLILHTFPNSKTDKSK